MLQAAMQGMLLEYDPVTQETTCLVDGFWFANGLSLSKGEDYILIVDTGHLEVLKYWITGSKVCAPSCIFKHRSSSRHKAVSYKSDCLCTEIKGLESSC